MVRLEDLMGKTSWPEKLHCTCSCSHAGAWSCLWSKLEKNNTGCSPLLWKNIYHFSLIHTDTLNDNTFKHPYQMELMIRCTCQDIVTQPYQKLIAYMIMYPCVSPGNEIDQLHAESSDWHVPCSYVKNGTFGGISIFAMFLFASQYEYFSC